MVDIKIIYFCSEFYSIERFQVIRNTQLLMKNKKKQKSISILYDDKAALKLYVVKIDTVRCSNS